MKRDFLKELGLPDDQIDKIMAENGKDVQAEQDKTATKQAEVDKLSEQLTEANKQVQAFVNMNVDDIKAKAQEFEEKFNQSQAELKEARETAMIEKALSTSNAHDIDVVKGLIKRDQLVFKDGNILGLDDQINELKKSKGFLFKEEEGASKPNFTTKAGGKETKVTKEQFDNMNYFARLELKQNDEVLYNELTKGE